MHDNNHRKPTPAGLSLLAGCAVILVVSGCATYGTPYGDEKVAVCHKSKKTLMLPESAVDAHLGHGDTMGPCE